MFLNMVSLLLLIPLPDADPCEHGGSCHNTPGSFACRCLDGYTGSRCESNLNECLSQPCRNGASCLDLLGQFQCLCPSGRNQGQDGERQSGVVVRVCDLGPTNLCIGCKSHRFCNPLFTRHKGSTPKMYCMYYSVEGMLHMATAGIAMTGLSCKEHVWKCPP